MHPSSRSRLGFSCAIALLAFLWAVPVSGQDASQDAQAPTDDQDQQAIDEVDEPLPQETYEDPETDASTEILKQMHMINRFEIRAGRMAVEKGSYEKVRRLGERVMRDHRVAAQKVDRMATRVNVSLPTIDFEAMRDRPEDELSTNQQRLLEALAALEEAEGADFDRTYAQAMQQTHRMAIDMLDTAVATIVVDDVAALVENVLPILEQHEDLARSVRRDLAADRES